MNKAGDIKLCRENLRQAIELIRERLNSKEWPFSELPQRQLAKRYIDALKKLHDHPDSDTVWRQVTPGDV